MHDTFWLCLENMAAGFDFGRTEEEQFLNGLELEMKRFSRKKRDRLTDQMTLVVAQLSRLVMRVKEANGTAAPA